MDHDLSKWAALGCDGDETATPDLPVVVGCMDTQHLVLHPPEYFQDLADLRQTSTNNPPFHHALFGHLSVYPGTHPLALGLSGSPCHFKNPKDTATLESCGQLSVL